MEYFWWIQIGLDAVLLLGILLLAARLFKAKEKTTSDSFYGADEFVQEAGRLAKEFDRLLGEKRELVGTLLATLDARIAELRAMIEQAEQAKQDILRPSKKIVAEFEPPTPQLSDDFSLPQVHPLRSTNNTPSVAQPATEQNFKEQVAQLVKQGKNVAEIVKLTGRPRGEVELVMALVK